MEATKTWNDLPHITDAEPFGPADDACLDEIRQILERHGKTGRFGVALLHHHFAIENDEILLESCDAEARTLSIRPVPAGSATSGDVMTTMYRFDDGARYGCTYCNKNHHN